ncbi:hypothetical protein IWZ00DRAFT_563708 [Phyllosticta capitalensis]|uniref:uncharacterized protein n=1 Tax=Phyllosticta capitalensis TaxID=121624 RepID=UPI0031325FAB
MDYNHLLSPDALFSPSKAAQQRAQAHDWRHVETWLSALYPNQRLPAFERNDETLKALMAMAAANERADEEGRLLEQLEDEVREELLGDETAMIHDQKQNTNNDIEKNTDALTTTIASSLSPTGLRALSFLSILSSSLNPATTYHAPSLAHVLIAHSTSQAALAAHSESLHHLRLQLAATLLSLRRTHDALATDPALAPHAALPRQTADFARQTKHLVPKLREYEERLAGLAANCPWAPAGTAAARPSTAGSTASAGSNLGASAAPGGGGSPTLSRRALHSPPSSSSPSSAPAAAPPPAGTHLLSSPLNPFSAAALSQLLAQTDELAALRRGVERLEGQVRAFRDLPADRDGARRVVRAREDTLRQLRAERDGAFEGLVG